MGVGLFLIVFGLWLGFRKKTKATLDYNKPYLETDDRGALMKKILEINKSKLSNEQKECQIKAITERMEKLRLEKVSTYQRR